MIDTITHWRVWNTFGDPCAWPDLVPMAKLVAIATRMIEPVDWISEKRKSSVHCTDDPFRGNMPFQFVAAQFGVMCCSPFTFMIQTSNPERAAQFFSWIREQSDERGLDEPELCIELAHQFIGVLSWYERSLLHPDLSSLTVWPLPNVWIAIDVQTQEEVDTRVPLLLELPAAKRVLTCSPTERMDLIRVQCESCRYKGMDYEYDDDGARTCPMCKSEMLTQGWLEVGVRTGMQVDEDEPNTIDWVILTGASSVPSHPGWLRLVRDQCIETDTPLFFDNWGAYSPFFDESRFTHGGREHGHNAHTWATEGGQFGPCWIRDSDGEWTGGETVETALLTDSDQMVIMAEVGSIKSGRKLDGKTWDQFPKVDRT